MTWVTVTIVALPLSIMAWWSITTKRPTLFLVAAGLLLGTALPLIAYAIQGDATAGADLQAYRSGVKWLCLISTLAFALGYTLSSLWPRACSDQSWPIAAEDTLAEHVNAATLVVTLGLASTLPGGIVGLALAGFERIPVDNFRFSLTYASACVLSFTVLVTLITRMQRNMPAPWLSMILLLGLFWILGGRAQFFVTLGSLALCFLGYGKGRLLPLMMGAGLFALVAVLTLHFRLSLQGSDVTLLETLKESLAQLSLLDGYAIALRYVEVFGVHPGLYLETLQQIIPRAIDPEKPEQLSALLRHMVSGDDLGGLTITVFGEFFVVGGFPALAVLGVGFGLSVGALDVAFQQLKAYAPSVQAALVLMIPMLGAFVLKAGFDNAIFRLDIIAACMVVAWLAASLRQRAAPRLLPPSARLLG